MTYYLFFYYSVQLFSPREPLRVSLLFMFWEETPMQRLYVDAAKNARNLARGVPMSFLQY